MNRSSKAKTRFCLLAILAFGLVCACTSPAPAATPPSSNDSKRSPALTSTLDEPLGPPDRVDVVYFHRSKACHCITVVGERIYATVWINFQDELASGELTFEMVDIDDPENATIVKKYNPSTFSLFINVLRGDAEHIVAIQEIWSGDRNATEELVKSKIEQSLEGRE